MNIPLAPSLSPLAAIPRLLLGTLALSAAWAADDASPTLRSAFGPKTAFAVHLDLTSARTSPVWRALAEQAPQIQESLSQNAAAQIPNLPAVPELSRLPDLPWDALAEIAVAVRGQDVLDNFSKDIVKEDASFLFLAQFSKSIPVDDVLSPLFAAAEQHKPGTRAALESSRRTVAGAAVVALPASLLEAKRTMPFGVSLAVLPASEATLVGLGRTETLVEFLDRKSTDTLSDRVERQLTRGTQLWIHAQIPEQKPPANMPQDNPMLAAMANSFAQVRDFTLGVQFADTALNLAVLLGCKDAAGATGLNTMMQGMLAFAQAGAQGGSSPAQAASARFLRTLKLAAEGATVRFAASLTLNDLLQGLGGKPGATTTAQMPKLSEPVERKGPPVQLEFLGLQPGDDVSVRWGSVRLKNVGDTPVEAVRVTFLYLDAAGRKEGEWTRRLIGETPVLVAPQASRTLRTGVFQMPSTATQVVLQLQEVEFPGGKLWTPER